ncbi:flagellar biosynthesis anti-sigma factor FlgM [Bacillus sp. B-jedd]|uniref:flagellar biosynthesis anti-sigma factor FlgM n=1 Tax=Bacillus sp. B-jedd TaxID=1476857 RepID=UPI00051571D5|nr:flagellar biosynthesis anti-sigma factor FlgM [Bacillus sp. B-jedd]CEG25902.1 flagellin synthesis regulatory protein [Bacillus sp. B-jedd]
MRIDAKYGFYSYQNQQNRLNNVNIEKKSSTSEVKISERGKEMAKAAASEQAERQKRVQELKQQIADGSYKVDSSKIADKLVGFWKNDIE